MIDVVIVSYNTCEFLRSCLESLEKGLVGRIVVVDNASTDGTREMVSTEFPQVLILANATNPGYGSAANQAIARCDSPYILLLNSDTRLEPGALQGLDAYLDRWPRAGIVGPLLHNPDGSVQRS